MRRADTGLGGFPGDLWIYAAGIAEGRGRHQQALCRCSEAGGKRNGRIEPVAVQADIDLPAAFRAHQAEEQNLARASAWRGLLVRQGVQHVLPGGERVERTA